MTPFTLWARYNREMNRRLYATCAELAEADLMADRGAFFGSVYRTLNHIMIADVYWLRRLDQRDQRFRLQDEGGAPLVIQGRDQILYSSLSCLAPWREQLDEQIVQCVDHLHALGVDGAQVLTHPLPEGPVVSFTANQALCHWFNHQTHHRGQITTLLTQMGHDVGVTDLLLMELDTV